MNGALKSVILSQVKKYIAKEGIESIMINSIEGELVAKAFKQRMYVINEKVLDVIGERIPNLKKEIIKFNTDGTQ